MNINLRQEIAMWVLGLLWTGFGIFLLVQTPFAPEPFIGLFLLLVPIGLAIFSLRERKKPN
jgi:hypothetical protein